MDFSFENEARSKGYSMICGIDEAGRGPLCGPVCAAAVVLPFGFHPEGINDSKKLSEKKRDALFDVIVENAVAYSVKMISAEEIDKINILQATFKAMRECVDSLEPKAEFALIDGNRSPGLEIPELLVVKGDSKSVSIAAASILAKVSRDRYMLALDEEYPQYCFSKHKGYGTKLHYECIERYGLCPEHRRSFLKKGSGWKNEKI